MLARIQKEASILIQAATSLDKLEACRLCYLGKKGQLTECYKQLARSNATERPIIGKEINAVKEAIYSGLEKQAIILKEESIAKAIASDALDVSLAGRSQSIGSLHPVTQTIIIIHDIFSKMGFTAVSGPEQEDDYHNFAALNIPPFHPARAMQDTFYFKEGSLLRTHLSSVEVHAMHRLSLPLRIFATGCVYRRDFDLTHTPMFHQMEGLMIDTDLSFSDLKSILYHFLHTFFKQDIDIRFRPSFFPFTEPSAEVDISCLYCHKKGCRLCKQTGWLEILGCGMIHPNVFKEASIDYTRYRGLAWGIGIDRLALLKYNIPDLRYLFENSLRFLKQF